jgi:3-deoxy-D-manno-octulosonate 8-phosphate phosphatase (KDO 8-P phosphatase)
MVTLSSEILRERCRRLRLVLSDVDGVLTDAGVYYSAKGEEMKRFSLRDGMGVELLRSAGIETAFLTREDSDIVRARARKLGLSRVYSNVRDKLAHLPEVLRAAELGPEQLAFIGDDVNDLALIEHLAHFGVTAAPADAVPAVRGAAHVVTAAAGGHGAFRELADTILANRTAG